MKRFLIAGTVAIIAMMAGGGAKANTIIDTTGSFSSNISPFGYPNTATYGEVFSVFSPDEYLNSFSLYLTDSATGSLNLKGYIAGWNGLKATSILYTSPLETMVGTGAGGHTQFAFAPNIALSPGNYVAFLSTSDLGVQKNLTFSMPQSTGGSRFAYYNNGTNFSLLTSNTWNCAACFKDAWFKADLSPVPEPASMALLGVGLAGLGLIRRRRA